MFQTILSIHSLLRWVVLFSLIYTIFTSYWGWFSKKTFTPIDDKVRHWTMTFAHIQLMIGIWLYVISPSMDYFIHNFKEAVHEADIRFMGMEHSLMMLIGIVVITIGSMKAKRKKEDTAKFKTIAIWYSIGLLIILLSIPWPFMANVSRPLFRSF